MEKYTSHKYLAWWFLTKRVYLCNQQPEAPSYSSQHLSLPWVTAVSVSSRWNHKVIFVCLAFTQHCVCETHLHCHEWSQIYSFFLLRVFHCGSLPRVTRPFLLLMDIDFISILIVTNSECCCKHACARLLETWIYIYVVCAPNYWNVVCA